MFRFEIGATILVRRKGSNYILDIEILAKAPNKIKARILSDGWFARDTIHWLDSEEWISIGRVK